MKRDMDLIRKLVLAIESCSDGWPKEDLKIDGYTADQIGYHAFLLVDAGLASGADVTSSGSSGPEYLLSHLTWAGHDFADACRDETIWRKAKATVRDKVGTVTFDVMKELLVSFLKSAVGLG